MPPVVLLHVAEVAAPPNDPARVTSVFEHIVWAGPAFAIATALIVTVVVALAVQPKAEVADTEYTPAIPRVTLVRDGSEIVDTKLNGPLHE